MENFIERSKRISSSTLKYTIRSRGIYISGRGITQHHNENGRLGFNVYSVNTEAINCLLKIYPNMPMFEFPSKEIPNVDNNLSTKMSVNYFSNKLLNNTKEIY